MRKVMFAAAVIGALLPMTARAQDKDPDKNVADGGVKVAGWEARLDKAGQKESNLKFYTMGRGMHVTTGPSGIFWNPSHMGRMTGKGYTVRGSFTQTKAPTHPEAYGIFAGGSDLGGNDVNYLYFIVRGDGKFMINHRIGTEVHQMVAWTENAAVAKQDSAGKATNNLAIIVGAEKVSFTVNGKEVSSLPSKDVTGPMKLKSLSGIGGIRVNHNLDVHIGEFEVVATK